MPSVPRIDGLRFPFHSNGGTLREPPHINALRDRDETGFWPAPEVSLAFSDGRMTGRRHRGIPVPSE